MRHTVRRIASAVGAVFVLVSVGAGAAEVASTAPSTGYCSQSGPFCDDSGCVNYCKVHVPGTIGVCAGYYDPDWDFVCECQCQWETLNPMQRDLDRSGR